MQTILEKLWLWITIGLGVIGILVFLSFILPFIFILVFPFLVLFFIWAVIGWIEGRGYKSKPIFDEDGARYTEASIISSQSTCQEISDGEEKRSS